MTPFIRISTPEAGPDEPRRLNPFPGRYLSEREFELLQAYVDDRITPLVAGLPAGIVSGMEVHTEGSGSNTLLHIQPGVAVGAGSRLVRLFYPLTQAWPELAELVERQQDKPLSDGLYLLTLRDVVEEIDKEENQEPCTRTELDPTRERRLETVILPSLRLITANPRWLAMPQSRAANRICVRFLKESPHSVEHSDIPVALVKVVNKNPEWIDTVAGRFLSEPSASYRTLLAHTVARLEQWMVQKQTKLQSSSIFNPIIPIHIGPFNLPVTKPSLSNLLGVDYLPSAAPLPTTLLQDPAGKQPKLMFNPLDLQVELAPVPASTISDVIERELPRGTVDLIHGLGDRIRLLLAIPDLDYRPTLMDLPQRDTALEDELFHREEAAAKAWSEWWQQWQLLFGGLTEEQCKLHQTPQYKLGSAQPNDSRPRDPNSYRDYLVTERIKALGDESLSTPEPYASHLLSPHEVEDYIKVENPSAPEEQLVLQQEGIRGAIEDLEKELDESYRLLNEMNDYLNLQRQQLDSLTISFSALAGGVAGDGAGSSMMRWNGAVTFDPTKKA